MLTRIKIVHSHCMFFTSQIMLSSHLNGKIQEKSISFCFHSLGIIKSPLQSLLAK